ncbi:MAG: hypothetical protein ACFFDN_27545 [Candidatus Hodarchaeota archaeon]
MDKIKLIAKVIDFERALEELRVPGLYRFYNTSLVIGRNARLLETIRGQGEIHKERLYDFASQFGYSEEYVEKIIIPKYVDWGFLTDSEETVDVLVTSQEKILSKCADDWIKKPKNPRDKFIIELLSEISKRPTFKSELELKLLSDKYYNKETRDDSILTLEAIKQLSKIKVEDEELFFNPEIIGDNVDKLPDIFSNYSEKDIKILDQIYDIISKYQGYPISSISQSEVLKGQTGFVESSILSGVLNSCDVTIGSNSYGFLFTGDILSPGKGDDTFHGIKETVSHFRFAENLANYKLHWLPRFLQVLLKNGEAGKASPIGTDYKLLERKGVIEVKRLGLSDRFRMYLVEGKEDYIEKTLDLISTNVNPIPPLQSSSLRDQLENIKAPPEARTNIDVQKLNELISRFIEKLRRTR